MIKAGILGGAGYTAGELIRLLINHPDVSVQWVQSNSHAGEPVVQVHQGLVGDTDIVFTDAISLSDIDVLFVCTQHGHSKPILDAIDVPEDLRIIDLSPDYRLASEDNTFLYGLPELNRRRIVAADTRRVACPGSYAMAVSLALLPLAKNLMVNSDIHVTAVKGSTAIGSSDRERWDYSWHNNNLSVYKPFVHEEVDEMRQSLLQLQNSFKSNIAMLPMRGPFPRGLLAAVYLDCAVDVAMLRELYESYYDDHNFTFVIDRQPDLKDVQGTNKCLLHLQRVGNKLLITSVIDNLLKGTSGTAVHNMNLLFGLHERVGLQLKASAF